MFFDLTVYSAIDNYLRELKTFSILLDIAKNDEDNSNSEIADSESLKKQINSDGLEDEENSEIADSEVLKREIVFLKSELEKEKEVSEKNLSKLRYLTADFDNYRKKIERQMGSKIADNKGQLFFKLLKVYDDCLL
ncbi:MAG: hypothetical protein QOK52_09305, partial [Nitrososphaeraceae archaeon]|nr:hypothetical protein [Nitrososphaeraceae archaeon]